MPELAEVEYFRKQWQAGTGAVVRAVHAQSGKRVFRGTDLPRLVAALHHARLLSAQASGKQILFSFSGGAWLGIHLGMTGKLRAASPAYLPEKHDHLVLRQARRSLVFTDPRQFGRIRFAAGTDLPEWWRRLPPAVTSPRFTVGHMERFLARHSRLPIKAALLLQTGFPGIGNWMADEALWQCGLHPRARAGEMDRLGSRRLWKVLRVICRSALSTIGQDYSDPPARWLFHARWKRDGRCPKHRLNLSFDTVGGRTTAWCPLCQPA